MGTFNFRCCVIPSLYRRRLLKLLFNCKSKITRDTITVELSPVRPFLRLSARDPLVPIDTRVIDSVDGRDRFPVQFLTRPVHVAQTLALAAFRALS